MSAGIWMQGDCGDFGAQGVALESRWARRRCGDAVEVAVVVAGDGSRARRCPGRAWREGSGEGSPVEVAGGGDADGTVGGEDVASRIGAGV